MKNTFPLIKLQAYVLVHTYIVPNQLDLTQSHFKADSRESPVCLFVCLPVLFMVLKTVDGNDARTNVLGSDADCTQNA